jgi:hypothetical protein
MSDESSYGEENVIGADLSDDDRNVLHLWRESLSLLDERYDDKVLVRLVAQSMVDDELRSRLVDDTDAVLNELRLRLAYSMKVRFFSNTPTTLNVVLPPPAGEAEKRSDALRDALRSRTSEAAFFEERGDDWNISDPGGRDPSIFFPPEDDAGAPEPPNGGTR